MSITYLIPLFLLASCMSTKITSKGNNETYWNEKWQNNSHNQNQANPFAIKALNYIKNNFKKPTIKLLDLGCGNGRDSLFFANNGAEVLAVDISEQALSSLKQSNPNISTQLQNFEYLNLPKNSFDIIYAHLSLHYFNTDKTLEIFNTVKSALKPGGVFFIKVKSIQDWQYGEGKQIA
jgi:tellurite methyltransferase